LRLVIDTDTASDDAVALMLALAEPGVTVEAITVVAGNVPLPQAVTNALVTCDVMGRPDVPVHVGRPGPILRPLDTAQDVHGANGMGGVELPEPSRAPDAEHAVAALVRLADEAPGERTLVTLGPLSNVATALLLDPEFLSKWAHVWCMYGVADATGNSSPTAEYNVWADPEAARVVLGHAEPGQVTFVGWDVSRKYAVMRRQDQDALTALGTTRARFVNDINAAVNAFCLGITGLEGYDLPDPIAMAAALRPQLILASEDASVDVISNGPGRGTLMIDRRPGARPAPNVRLVTEVDEIGFKHMLLAMCATGPAKV
jgi:purine nucleosidase